MNTANKTMRTRAAFILPGATAWRWIAWNHGHASKHAAIIEKAGELGAVAWDFGQADHGEIDRMVVR